VPEGDSAAAARPAAQVLPVARGQAFPNKTFISEWGDSLKEGSERVWAGYLQSSYGAANEEVHGKVRPLLACLRAVCREQPQPRQQQQSSSPKETMLLFHLGLHGRSGR
jgi:hypothetical protein